LVAIIVSALAFKFYYYIVSWLRRLKKKTFCGEAKEEIFKEVHVTGSDNGCKVSRVRLILSPKLRSTILAT
jgi:hypothetical protein